MKINSVTKDRMVRLFGRPYFGYTANHVNSDSEAWLRNDLPVRVQASVKAHELQHVADQAFLDGRVWHWEVRAWRAGLRADWRGFFQAIWMSVIDRERLVLYWKRMTQGF